MFTHPSAVTVGHECLRPSAGQRLRNLLEGLRRRGACEAPRVHGLARATTFSVTPGRGGLSVTGVRGTVVWRAFVYSAEDETDRAKQAYAEFVPLDGQFAVGSRQVVRHSGDGRHPPGWRRRR